MLKEAIRKVYKIEKVGKEKYEIFILKSGFKKIITVYYTLDNKLICISGSEGGHKEWKDVRSVEKII